MKTLNKPGWYSRFIEMICWAFFGLFMYAAISKLLEFEKFKATMGKSAMLTPYADVLAWAVPVAEIVIAFMVQFDRFRKLGLYAFLSLMTMFTAYILIVLGFMDSKPCGCGGLIEAMGWGWHMVFNIFFMILGVIGIWLEGQNNHSLHRGNGVALLRTKINKSYRKNLCGRAKVFNALHRR